MIIQGDSLHLPLADNSIDSIVTDPPYGISFMSRKWDYDIPSVALWKEVLRVMKPGAHALVACGTRTQHRMAVNLEDAGFEIRDVVVWAYGSGFPKSMDLGKAYDKFCGNEREVVGEKTTPDGVPYSKISPNSVGKYNESCAHNSMCGRTKHDISLTKGQSEYEGWGTALKPAVELWTLCRKPLSEKTIIENVIKHGTGGINIDGCRVPMDEVIKRPAYVTETVTNVHMEMRPWMLDRIKKGIQLKKDFVNSSGRFPANLIHDGSDEVVSLFPMTKSGSGIKKRNSKSASTIFNINKVDGDFIFGDQGSASRFFYCAKASSSERNAGLDGLEEKDIIRKVKNNHPTVKPVALMKYLCRLITHKNGTVLDPFCGSGSTGLAAKEEGFKFIGIEREFEYANIAYHRYNHQPKNYQIPII